MRPAYRGAHRRFARQLRQAHYLATDDEAVDLERMRRLVSAEALCPFDAQEILRGVIRSQLERGALKGKKAA
jgi:hypothetical protein